MTFIDYIEDHLSFIMFSIIWLVIEGVILISVGVSPSIITIVSVIWIVLYSVYICYDWSRKSNYMKKLLQISSQLDQPYLLHEVMPKTSYHEDAFYHEILYRGYKSMLEEVSHVRRDRNEYREYIEQWVHEIKTPIAAMKLTCENQKMDKKQAVLRQIERVQLFIDQALFYARSEVVEKDFQIRETSSLHCVQQAFLECKYICLQANACIELPVDDMQIYTDEKWLIFILCQLIENAIKYRNPDDPLILIRFEQIDKNKIICVEDHGNGIAVHDISRIFYKGFTGDNGRCVDMHATGIGLYLVKRLCDQMQISINVESTLQKGSTFQLFFR